MKYLAVFTALFGLFYASPARADEAFRAWLVGLAQEAEANGVSSAAIQSALGQIEFLPRVIELDQKQPEGTITFERYIKNVLPVQRVRRGRELYLRHHSELKRISDKYGVPGKVLVALWGMESSYGDNTGGYDVVSSLATLAYEGRRRDFFKDELIKALQILDAEHISLHKMSGSWAGAMGQCQFMPSSFLKFAVDYNGDGHRDIWTTETDVLASAANYLSKSGWKRGEIWGREVRVPRNIPMAPLIGHDKQKSIKEWAKLGFRKTSGGALPAQDIKASLVMPDGPGGRAFLVYDNFRVIMKWNRSTYFASAIGLLADKVGD